MLRPIAVAALAALALGCGADAVEAPEAEALQCADRTGEPFVEIGVTPSREPELQFFPVFPDEPIPLEFGSQAAYMVVFGVKSDVTPDPGGTARLAARLVAEDGEVLSEMPERSVPLLAHTDGYQYAWKWILELRASNTVLRIFDWDGSKATIMVDLTTQCDGTHHRSVPVWMAL